MRLLFFITCLTFGFLTSSCSLFGAESFYHQQQVAYSKAKDGPGLTVNPPLTASKISDAYVIPPVEKAPVSTEAPPPPGSLLAKENKPIPSSNVEEDNKRE